MDLGFIQKLIQPADSFRDEISQLAPRAGFAVVQGMPSRQRRAIRRAGLFGRGAGTADAGHGIDAPGAGKCRAVEQIWRMKGNMEAENGQSGF